MYKALKNVNTEFGSYNKGDIVTDSVGKKYSAFDLSLDQINHAIRYCNNYQVDFSNSILILSEKTKQDPLDVFEQAIKNISPVLEVRSRRIGGANYQIPYQVRGDRRFTLGCRWLIEAARSKKGMTMKEKLN